jgi:putative lipoic acid-binding regulatory protein
VELPVKPNFKQLLDEHHQFPHHYEFRFIVPSEHLDHFKLIIGECDISVRDSKNGKYLGLSFKLQVFSSDEIMAFYEKASKVKGVIAL